MYGPRNPNPSFFFTLNFWFRSLYWGDDDDDDDDDDDFSISGPGNPNPFFFYS